MAKRERVRTAKQIERRKSLFTFLKSMALGAVKFWIHGRKIILPGDQVSHFLKLIQSIPLEQVDKFLTDQIDNVD